MALERMLNTRSKSKSSGILKYFQIVMAGFSVQRKPCRCCNGKCACKEAPGAWEAGVDTRDLGDC